MKDKICLVKYRNSCNCYSSERSSIEGFPAITHDFDGGKIHGVLSDFGCGGWALCSCLGGRGAVAEGEIQMNERALSQQTLQSYSCFLGEILQPEVNTADEPSTARECITRALLKSQLPYSTEDIKKIFQLSDERFDRALSQVSGEIWDISLAIGYALNRKIFCFPWMNQWEFSRNILNRRSSLEYLKQQGKFVFLPMSPLSNAWKICDTILYIKNDGIYSKKKGCSRKRIL